MSWQIDRKQFVEELQLRQYIRKAIKVVQERKEKKKSQQLLEEQELRKYVRRIIEVEVADATPHHSTGINVLEDLLKKIIPIIEDGFKDLTSSKNQRDSFRAHIVRGVQTALSPIRAIEDGTTEKGEGRPYEPPGISGEKETPELAEQEINIDVGEEGPPPEFIDINPPDEKSKEEKKEEEFTITDKDTTGRNLALDVFKRIERNVVDAYDLLSDEEDEKLFYDYLLTNLKLYFDKFEEELHQSLPEPTTPEYEAEKEKLGATAEEEELALEEEIDFDIRELERLAET